MPKVQMLNMTNCNTMHLKGMECQCSWERILKSKSSLLSRINSSWDEKLFWGFTFLKVLLCPLLEMWVALPV